MASTNNQAESQEKPSYFIRKSLSPGILLHRSPVVLLLVYYVWILLSAWSMHGWSWSLEEGVIWSSGPPGSFIPIPSMPGNLLYIASAYLIDQVFYLIFMHSGIWIAWIALGVLYIFSPYRLEKSIVCSVLKGTLIIEIILFLLGAILVTNMHPRGLQFSVYAVGLMLFVTMIVWLIFCRWRKSDH